MAAMADTVLALEIRITAAKSTGESHSKSADLTSFGIGLQTNLALGLVAAIFFLFAGNSCADDPDFAITNNEI